VAQTLRGKAEALSLMEKLRTSFLVHAVEELKGPLNAVARAAGKVAARAEPGLRSTAADILAAAEDIKALIDDVSDVAALDGGQQSLRLDSIDVSAIVARAVAMTREAVRARNIDLTVDCPAQIGWIVGDGQRLKQTVFHLLTTALDASGSGAVTLAVRRGDDGRAIEIAFRYVAAAALDHGASALGLHFARRIAELHGGGVEVQPDGGEAVLTCRLPAEPLRAASAG
jgi:signal transduction histidine kinase